MNPNDRFERYQATHRTVIFPRPTAAPSTLRDAIVRANSAIVRARAVLALRGPAARRDVINTSADDEPDVLSDAFLEERANGRSVDPFQALQDATANEWRGLARGSDASERTNGDEGGGDPFERLQRRTERASERNGGSGR